MSTNQPLKITAQLLDSTHNIDAPAVTKAVQLGEFVLSISNMLGCDYIFISHSGLHPLLSEKYLQRTIRELLDMLDTSPRQSLIVSADEAPDGTLKFTRYDYLWENRKVTKIMPNNIDNKDQVDFMCMMYDCSSTC